MCFDVCSIRIFLDRTEQLKEKNKTNKNILFSFILSLMILFEFRNSQMSINQRNSHTIYFRGLALPLPHRLKQKMDHLSVFPFSVFPIFVTSFHFISFHFLFFPSSFFFLFSTFANNLIMLTSPCNLKKDFY